jgi:hypothetical protein
MGLSRLSNFLKNVKGNIIYVDPNSLDSTDSVENQGNSLTRPFKTIQRALIEAARFSYQRGKKNDRFLKTTILLYPGEHYIDNRPGYIPIAQDQYLTRGGTELTQVLEWDFQSNFDVFDTTNDLYKVNSVFGGVIVPRGTSIVGMDLRKTKVRPLYVPSPTNDDIERTALFRVTGGCYFWQFTIFDGDPNGLVYRDYTANLTTPNFSHHKLTVFEYADGLNPVKIQDEFVPDSFENNIFESEFTDLEMYYQKVGLLYGLGVGRPISPDFPSVDVDIEPVVDEYRVVGSKGLEVGIGTIRSGNGIVGTTEITVVLDERVDQISVDTPIQINGISEPGYSGQFAVAEVVDNFTFKYIVGSVPEEINPSASGSTVNITVDTVSSASPYIFNCSLRSVYGMCGLHADGSKATGFRSMVVAQYTGIGLQKDDNAFARYDATTGTYVIGEFNAHTNSRSRFRPSYENYHIKASNNAFLQLVSVFAIGFANHFLAESGGDHSITNSNSNFGAKSLVSSGFRDEAFIRDDCGYITSIVTPRDIEIEEETIEFLPVDVIKTVAANNSTRLYLLNQTDFNNPPNIILNGYKVGGSKTEKLFVNITDPDLQSTDVYTAEVVFSNTIGAASANIQGEKLYRVGRNNVTGINSITNNIIEFDTEHTFGSGESVIPIPISGPLPDGLEIGRIYYVYQNTSNLLRTIKLARTQDDAINQVKEVVLNNKGGIIDFTSRVIDKSPGEPGSPILWDSGRENWYITVNQVTNTIFPKLLTLYNAAPVKKIGSATPKTYIKRKQDTRSNDDKIYKFRYVIPKENILTCRPPIDSYILQDSSSTNASDSTELSKYFPLSTVTIDNPTQIRNFRYILNAQWQSNLVTITTELPHNLKVGNEVEIKNIISTNNLRGDDDKGFNGTFTVFDVTSSRQFTYLLISNPGTFNNNTNSRNPSDLPTYINKRFKTTYQIFRSDEIQPYEKDRQDGIYHLTITNASNNPNVTPFRELSFSQPIQNLYPQLNRDNPDPNPFESLSIALPDPIGQVSINDSRRSITKETLVKGFTDFNLGFSISDIQSTTATTHKIITNIDHNLNGVTRLTINNQGSNYVDGLYYNVSLVGAAGSTTGSDATCVVRVQSGQVSEIVVQNPGSAYGIGNTLTPVGISTAVTFVPSNTARLSVNAINNSRGFSIGVSGISSHRGNIEDYNGYYIIDKIDTGKTKEIDVISAKSITTFKRSVSGSTNNSIAIITGLEVPVSSIEYTPSTGIGTIGFSTSHPFRVGSSIILYGATDNFFNNKETFFVTNLNNNLTSVRVDMGKSSTTPVTTGTIKAILPFNTANRGSVSGDNEFKSSRLLYNFDKYIGIVQTDLQATGNASLVLNSSVGLNIGDYLLIDNEIVRIKSTIISNSLVVERALMGTRRDLHVKDSLVRRIKVLPTESRRNSIIRASGHTFEYLGYGPGNYSTALPERQDRVLTPQEEILSQSTKIDGGTILYSAMNSDGDFYNNNRKLTSNGKDQIYDSPIPTVSGEVPSELASEGGFNLLTPEEVVVNRSIKVNGGPNSKLISEFGGPTIFNEKITSTAEDGIEFRKAGIRGELEVSREITVSSTRPTKSANIGDIVLNGTPELGENAGWIYVVDPLDNQSKWQGFGWINDSLYGVDISAGSLTKAITRELRFQGSGIVVSAQTNQNSGLTTVTFTQSSAALNQIGVATGSLTQTIPDLSSGIPADFNGQRVANPVIKFVGDPVGFGVSINVQYPPTSLPNTVVGVATVVYRSPIVPVNFGVAGADPVIGTGAPTFTNRTTGTRIIYDNKLSSTSVDFAVGRAGINKLWYSVPLNDIGYGWQWYAGTTNILEFSRTGEDTELFIEPAVSPGTAKPKWEFGSTATGFRLDLRCNGLVEGGILRSTLPADKTTAPIQVTNATLVNNLNSNFVNNFLPRTEGAATFTSGSTTRNTIPVREAVTGTDSNTYSQIRAAATQLMSTGNIGRAGSYFEGLVDTLRGSSFNITNGAQVTGISTFSQISDIVNTAFTVSSNVATVDFRNGPVSRRDTNFATTVDTLNITNVPSTPNRTYNYTLAISSPSTPTGIPSKLQITVGATTFTIPSSNIRWLNGTSSVTSSGTSGEFVVGFTFFCDSAGNFASSTTAKVLAVFGSYV